MSCATERPSEAAEPGGCERRPGRGIRIDRQTDAVHIAGEDVQLMPDARGRERGAQQIAVRNRARRGRPRCATRTSAASPARRDARARARAPSLQDPGRRRGRCGSPGAGGAPCSPRDSREQRNPVARRATSPERVRRVQQGVLRPRIRSPRRRALHALVRPRSRVGPQRAVQDAASAPDTARPGSSSRDPRATRRQARPRAGRAGGSRRREARGSRHDHDGGELACLHLVATIVRVSDHEKITANPCCRYLAVIQCLHGSCFAVAAAGM